MFALFYRLRCGRLEHPIIPMDNFTRSLCVCVCCCPV